MALSAGTAFIDVKPKLAKTFGASLKGGLGSALGGAGKLAAVGGLAIGAAIAGGAVASIKSFADLEAGMNEVFTLLPGISQDAMSAMTDQVKDFSKDFGVLPNEVVPALYQALSAGVPPDNVFEFLEVGQKAALGGVTNLETAVDGISSVVNAYGSDVIGAAEASDLMFTAVRLGKTNFEELSASLFNVIPTAAALGVGFGDITAALATMTAQGVPTSVATTQLRSLMVELSKDGTKVSDIFKELSGQSFAEFNEAGGDTAQALGLLVEHADSTGVALQDMFGSVEAGAAALALTGSDAFVENLDAMGESAGSTDAAFDQMDQGLSRTWDKIKATVSVALADIGAKLAPFVEKAAEWLGEVLPKAIEFFSGIVEKLGPVFSAVFGVIGNIFGIFASDTEEGTEKAGSALGGLGGLFESVGGVIAGVVEVIKGILGGLMAFWDSWGGTIISVLKTVWDTVIGVLTAAFDIIKGIFDVVIGILTGDWSRAWEGIKNILKGVWNAIVTILKGAWNLVVSIVGKVLSTLWNLVKGGVGKVLQIFKELPGKILGFLASLPGKFFQLAVDLIAGLIKGLGNIAGLIGDKIKGGISSAIDGVKSFFGIGSPSKVMAEIVGAPLSEGIALGIQRAAVDVTNELTTTVTSAQDAAEAAVDTIDLELLRFGTTGDVLDAINAAVPTATAASVRGLEAAAVPGGSAGTHIELHDGAIQIINPEPEPASTEIPRTMRRLERRYSRG